jgi:NAD(P)-dependent dehydrogenase (short-subunit alcohol dehydrogenase family)
MQTGLADKTVLITGAANGIGRSTALAFADEGAHVAMVDHDQKELEVTVADIRKRGVNAYAIVGDLSTATGCQESLDAILKQLPSGVDVLFNNVGYADPKAFMDIPDAQWERTFQLNFMSAVRVTRHLLPILRKQEKAVVIMNASDLARQPEPAPADYGAMKAAMLSLTKSLARSEAPRIRVNAVAPGPIWSTFWSRPGGFADGLAAIHKMPPRQAVDHEMKLRQLPLERLGNAEEVANVVVFLASDLASYVTSSVWGVDGGSIRSIL